jgi:hypothetical protein
VVYAPVLLAAGLPWSLLVVPVACFLLSRAQAVRAVRPQALGFFVLWAGWCFVFFSLSRGKLPPYILPMTPALAVVIGCYLERALRMPLARFCRPAGVSVPHYSVAMIASLWLAASVSTYALRLTAAPATIVNIVVSAGCLLVVVVWCRALSPRAAWALFCGLGLMVTFTLAQQIVPAWAARRAPMGHSSEVVALLQDGSIPVVCFGGEWGSIPFYLRHDNVRTITGWSVDELATFLGKHQRNLVVFRSDVAALVLSHLPPGMTVTRLLDAGTAKVALVARNE